ncbi:LysR family transcriptional regulator [Brevibacillus humidisoli]|uniref:LysR family transcriptional regulator n=1 Tax=Brevibacillus humidisoli TaxID=2895522 RepID=UPI001E435CF3|nr:LysR family transcriptional regulator [Brevibacillus humidisoli]UFJ41175.1 LysR family transcriptional regulator [Brevibacillus humidisoli]
MEIRQLLYFLEVAKERSFTKAATRLHLTQPTLSKSIARLEEELGLPLLQRKEHKVSLTAEGEVLLRHAERIVGCVEDALREIAELKGLTRGEIRIGLPPMVGTSLFPDLLAGFLSRYPGIRFSAFEEGALSVEQKLIQQEIDLGIVIPDALQEPEKMELIPLTRADFAVCLSNEHPLARQSNLTVPDLREESFILLKEGFFQRRYILEECRKANFQPNVIYTSNQLEIVKQLITRNLGISLLLRMAVEREPLIRCVPLKPALTIELAVAYRKGSYLSKASQALVQHLKQTLP